MKTIKLLSLLFSGVLIVGACDCKKCETELTKTKYSLDSSLQILQQQQPVDRDRDAVTDKPQQQQASCYTLGEWIPLGTAVDGKNYKVDFNASTKNILLINRFPTPDDTCKINLVSNDSLQLIVASFGSVKHLQINAFTSIPTLGYKEDVITKPTGNDLFLDIVKNNFNFPFGSVLKIIGSDNGRNYDVSKTTAPYSISSLEQPGGVYLRYIAATETEQMKYKLNAPTASMKKQSECSNISKSSMKSDTQ